MRALILSAAILLPLISCVPARAAGDAALSEAITFMGDSGDGTGVWLTDWLKAHRARYEFSSSIEGTSSRRVDTDAQGRVPVILINEKARGSGHAYAYYAVLAAREAAEFVHMGMPESAEKRYMVYSCMAEVYFELYGTRADLPMIGGVKDEEAAAQINAWVWDGPDSGPDAVAQGGKYKKISTLMEETSQAIAQAKQAGSDTAALEVQFAQLQKERITTTRNSASAKTTGGRCTSPNKVSPGKAQRPRTRGRSFWDSRGKFVCWWYEQNDTAGRCIAGPAAPGRSRGGWPLFRERGLGRRHNRGERAERGLR